MINLFHMWSDKGRPMALTETGAVPNWIRAHLLCDATLTAPVTATDSDYLPRGAFDDVLCAAQQTEQGHRFIEKCTGT